MPVCVPIVYRWLLDSAFGFSVLCLCMLPGSRFIAYARPLADTCVIG
jgi:hypothetical protein